jgi:DNA-directed RNA polymerase specialized sigma24 family protein
VVGQVHGCIAVKTSTDSTGSLVPIKATGLDEAIRKRIEDVVKSISMACEAVESQSQAIGESFKLRSIISAIDNTLAKEPASFASPEAESIVTLLGTKRPVEERERALEFLYMEFKEQVRSKLRRQAWPELKRSAARHRRSCDAEFRLLVSAGIFQALEWMKRLTLADIPWLREALPLELERLVEEDLLGPDWRRTVEDDYSGLSDKNKLSASYARQANQIAEIETRLTARRIFNSKKLSKRQRQLFSLIQLGYTKKEAAQHMGISVSTAYVLFSKSRKTLKKK